MDTCEVKAIVESFGNGKPFKTSDFIEWVKLAKETALDLVTANRDLQGIYRCANPFK
ncbi:hypothetical protein [uncultured Shewanella sp.]|uniref:hypothetical protein n=1 Tax=uncultured Shewanella sp. TaxID=173975 RepID=UPI00260180A9|nr:hypothetical protein [uncultured Shewanella sp.]